MTLLLLDFSGASAAGLFRRSLRADTVFERVRIIPDGHDKRQQLSEGLIFGLKFEQDAAGREVDSVRQTGNLLIDDLCGGFDENPRLLDPGTAQFFENRPKFPPALAFIVYCIASRNSSQVEDQLVSIGNPVTADGLGDNGGHQLLGTAGSYAENFLQSLAIYPGGGKCFELAADFVESANPGRLVGHLTFQSSI